MEDTSSLLPSRNQLLPGLRGAEVETYTHNNISRSIAHYEKSVQNHEVPPGIGCILC